MHRISRLILALIYLAAGTLLGVLLFDVILRANNTLLLRGMALPAPVDPPLTTSTYEVHYSDADEFFWRPDLIKPVPPDEDRLEARVTYETDEYGFRNHGPLPPRVDAVILGRSISLAGHLDHPWPTLLAERLGWTVLNLSQPGSGIGVKLDYLERYGLPRQPHWVVIEVVPSIDIRGTYIPAPLISQELAIPAIQALVRRWTAGQSVSTDHAIYPLPVDLPGRRLGLTCCMHYLEFFSLDRQTLDQSQDWLHYRQNMLKIVETARKNNACVALLYVPTKPDLYFPLALRPDQLEPALREVIPLHLGTTGWLEPDPGGAISIEMIRLNALAGHDLMQDFARQNGLVWIDPHSAMALSAAGGQDPFMVYDSHWNQLGHDLVAETAADLLGGAACP